MMKPAPTLIISIVIHNPTGQVVQATTQTVDCDLPTEEWLKTEVKPVAAQFVAEATKDLTRIICDGLDLGRKPAHTLVAKAE